MNIALKVSQRQSVSEGILYGNIIAERGNVVMTGEVKGEKAATKFRSAMEVNAEIVGESS
jgi:Fe-S cluster assembly scaffold protein SufB